MKKSIITAAILLPFCVATNVKSYGQDSKPTPGHSQQKSTTSSDYKPMTDEDWSQFVDSVLDNTPTSSITYADLQKDYDYVLAKAKGYMAQYAYASSSELKLKILNNLLDVYSDASTRLEQAKKQNSDFDASQKSAMATYEFVYERDIADIKKQKGTVK